MLREGGTADSERVAFGFRLATGRRATDDEVAILVDGLKTDRDRFKKEPDAANSLLGFGETAPASDLDPPDQAAYTLTANVLLNLDEFVMRE